MTRCRILLLLTVFTSLPTFAGTIEVAQWIPWDFVTQETINRPIDVTNQIPELEMRIQELRPKILGLEFSLQGEVSDFSFSSAGIKSSQNLKANIHIEELVIDQMITREFNGNQIQVHLKAECSPINLSIPYFSTIADSAFIQDGNIWRPELSQLELNIPDWTISPIECTGIGGIGNEISSQITKALKNPAIFEDLIRSWLSEELKNTIHLAWSTLIESASSSMAVTSMEKPSDKGFMVYAELPIFKDKTIGLPLVNDYNLSAKIPQLIISPVGFEALLEDKFLKMVPQKFDLQKVEGFARLMRSRFLQLFVWPDLRRFSTSTPFTLSTDMNQSQLRLVPGPDGQWNAYLNANGSMKTVMGGSEIDYILFGVGVATKIKIKIEDGKIKLSTGSSQLQMAWSFGTLYQMIFRPNTRISIDLLKSSINQLFTNQKIEEALPVINWQERQWKLQNWKVNSDIITMDWL